MQAMAKLETAADVKERLLDRKFSDIQEVSVALRDFEDRSKKLHHRKFILPIFVHYFLRFEPLTYCPHLLSLFCISNYSVQ